MKVSSLQPFKIIYSLYQHEYLGYLFESFVVQLNDKGNLTLQHQNISSKNAEEFAHGLDDNDYELIKLMDRMQQESVVLHFSKKKQKASEFFLKVYDGDKKNEPIQSEIHKYLERKRARILELLEGKNLFEMGNDGEPAWRIIEVMEGGASVLFHFRVNDENTHYFPTIKHDNEKVEFQYKGTYLICKEPAWFVVENKLYGFKDYVEGNKLAPFLNKNFILIPKKLEEIYYRKFVSPLVAAHKVYAKGFQIKIKNYDPEPILTFSQFENGQDIAQSSNGNENTEDARIAFEIKFKYGRFRVNGGRKIAVDVELEKNNGEYVFYKILRDTTKEKGYLGFLKDLGLDLRFGNGILEQKHAFSWLNKNLPELKSRGFDVRQAKISEKKYFLGTSSINIEIRENIDWFDVYALVKFGEFEIPFNELRKHILNKKYEIKLPNGEVAVIPEVWFEEYSELFAFIDQDEKRKRNKLKKHHLALVKDLESGDLAKVSMKSKLGKLENFEQIDDIPVSKNFRGTLRPYQKAGYNWLQFLNTYKFGGCLADDMGLGKTVQTLAMLQAEKDKGPSSASLIIMPTSLIYNWEMEAEKFTPRMNILAYMGTNRDKDVASFNGYDLILTSYGIARLDVDLLKEYYYNYVILDESQAIKNPGSHISRAVKELKSRSKLILTGTPLENSTMDLWSQMGFINPGLLGGHSFFKKEFLKPIEKLHNEDKTRRLYTIIKPFILRRNKSEVLADLPDKVENVHYCKMTTTQEEQYEQVKSQYRNQILKQIDDNGLNKSHIMLLKGLTQLRQLANHPKLIDPDYQGDSGKMDDIIQMMTNAFAEEHKILIFSQFVKHLSLFRSYLESQHIDFAYLDGSTKNRKEQVERFQNEEDLRVFLISLKAGGLGLNLTKADYVFILDPWWNPAAEAQAIDRAHRIGQQNTVITYKFITQNTVEEKIMALQKRKLALAGDLIRTEEGLLKSLSRDDISTLLE